MEELEYKIESSLDKGLRLITELKEKWLRAGLDEETVFFLRLVLEEAVANAIKHGNQQNENLMVEVKCKMLSDCIELEVKDQGTGFDYDTVADPTLEDLIAKPGGRGVYFINKLMDKVEFLEHGSRVKMVKKTHPKETNQNESRAAEI